MIWSISLKDLIWYARQKVWQDPKDHRSYQINQQVEVVLTSPPTESRKAIPQQLREETWAITQPIVIWGINLILWQSIRLLMLVKHQLIQTTRVEIIQLIAEIEALILKTKAGIDPQVMLQTVEEVIVQLEARKATDFIPHRVKSDQDKLIIHP